MGAREIVSALVLGLFSAMILAACSLLPCVERRHASGLLLTCPERIRETPESLKAASSYAYELAEQHPDAFGYPWVDPDTGELEVRVTDPAADVFVRQWIAGGAKRGTGDKALPLPPPEVPPKLVTVDRSFRQLEGIKDGAVPPKDLPDGDLIYMTAPDARRNAVTIGIDHQSDALLNALAERYGTAAIVIRIEPNPHIGY